MVADRPDRQIHFVDGVRLLMVWGAHNESEQ